MPPTLVTNPLDPRLAEYQNLKEVESSARLGVFIAEGREVVRTLIVESPFETRSVLVNEAAFEALRDVLEPLSARTPVYLAPQGVLDGIAGFHVHRGCLAIGVRQRPRKIEELADSRPAHGAVLGVALEQLRNHDNVGGIFRNALAFGASFVCLSRDTADPLYRKAVRVSMGAALRVPFAQSGHACMADEFAALHRAGFTTVALTPAAGAEPLEAVLSRLNHAAESAPARVLLLVGTEGEGLQARTIEGAMVRARIAMMPGVDSLNASTATGIALHALARALRLVR